MASCGVRGTGEATLLAQGGLTYTIHMNPIENA